MPKDYRYDCRQFTGYKPCAWDCACDECDHYAPKQPRVLIVRVHQLGNVVKSSPIVHALHKRFDDPWITWLTSRAAAPLVRANPLVDEVVEYSWEATPMLMQRQYDLVLSLEANAAEVALAQLIPSTSRLGFGLHESGSLIALNEQSEPYVRLSVSDKIRFHQNRKTLAELLFDLVGVPYEGEEYLLEPAEDDVNHARQTLIARNVTPGQQTIVGFATGGDSERFANKDWPIEHFAELGRILQENTECRIVLLGGPQERAKNEWLAEELGSLVIDAGCEHTIMQFSALLGLCDLVVCGDCFPMHAAVAVGTPVVSVFGPTPPQEMAIFGRGRKVITEETCAPCYLRGRNECPHGWICMPGISPERVLQAIIEVLEEKGISAPG